MQNHFADSAGLKLKFDRQITDEELAQIEALFSEGESSLCRN